MKEIELTQGFVALVDDEDYERVNSLTWHVQRGRYTWYAQHVITSPVRRVVYMHRYILGLLDSKEHVDHKNRNGLDNRKENLRLDERGVNSINRRGFKNNKSGFRGVCWHKKTRMWTAQIGAGGKLFYIGVFERVEDAARAYDAEAVRLHGDHAQLNFPTGATPSA